MLQRMLQIIAVGVQVSFQNSEGQLVSFCLDNIQIIGGSGRVSSSSIGRHRI